MDAAAFALAGMVLAVTGCLCVYLAARHQQWLRRPWPARRARAAGAAMLVASIATLAQGMQRTTAAFVFVTLVMLSFTLLPGIGAWLALRRGAAK